MKKNSISILALLSIIFSMGLGCKYLQFSKEVDRPTRPEDVPALTKTTVTKDVLIERLSKKGVESVPSPWAPVKPNPNTLYLRLLSGGSPRLLRLNQDEHEFDDLVNTLKAIFKDREERGVFKEGTNEVEKDIILGWDESALTSKGYPLYVEDYEKLVDDLRKEGIDQLKVSAESEKTAFTDEDEPPPVKMPTGTPRPAPKVVSGGVVNGKALNFVKPPYPPAAKAVRAAGAVSVQVTIDEQGNVTSATAVSGHPLLKATSESAARALKFEITKVNGVPVKVTGVVVYTFVSPE